MPNTSSNTAHGDRKTVAPRTSPDSIAADADIGLTPSVRSRAIALMNTALANTSLLTIKTKKFHWDVVGPQFLTLHQLWDEQYETLGKYADETAERIRQLDGYPVGTARGFLNAAELAEHPGDVPVATDAVRYLLEDHQSIARSLRKAIDACSEDAGTADFLTGMLRGHEKMAWMLRSFLIGEAVKATGAATHGHVPRDA